jgi:hypothetical protein
MEDELAASNEIAGVPNADLEGLGAENYTNS